MPKGLQLQSKQEKVEFFEHLEQEEWNTRASKALLHEGCQFKIAGYSWDFIHE